MIKVSNLSKRYLISHNGPARVQYRRFSEEIARALNWPLRAIWQRVGLTGRTAEPDDMPPAGAARREEFWALRDVGFEVDQGEVVGIIGRNGAGKSTLLKLLSRITEPTTGRIELRGRVASLLEVGTGFHPELTGRENIFLNGAILGMTRAEIKRKFDEIVAFAEVEKFVDTPVKRYSSGMYVRLAFAVAAHLEPEILVVDEVLAVGDAEFQKKCLGKMRDAAQGGRTVLFVSHNMAAVARLCSKSLLLNKGRLAAYGATSDIINTYVSKLGVVDRFERSANSDEEPRIISGAIVSSDTTSEIRLLVELVGRPGQHVSVDVRLHDGAMNPVGFGSLGAFDQSERIQLQPGVTSVLIALATGNLATGTYLISLDLTLPEVQFFDRVEQCLKFEVDCRPLVSRRKALPQTWGYGSYEVPLIQISE